MVLQPLHPWHWHPLNHNESPDFRFERFLNFIGEVVFGAGAESMAASWPHDVVVPASLALASSESYSDMNFLVDLGFMLQVLIFDWRNS